MRLKETKNEQSRKFKKDHNIHTGRDVARRHGPHTKVPGN